MSENENHEDGGTFASDDVININAGNSKFIAIQNTEPNHKSDGQVWVNDGVDPLFLQTYDTTNADWKTLRPVIYTTADANRYPITVSAKPQNNGALVVSYISTLGDTHLWIRANGKYWTIQGS